MYKVVIINGGIGRVYCSIPALEKFIKNNPESYIVCQGGIDLFWGNSILQDRVYDISTKGLFENIIRDGQIVFPEPYHVNEYYNQKINIYQAFDKLINGYYENPENYRTGINISKDEFLNGVWVNRHAIKVQGKKKNIVIQPFGRGIYHNTDVNDVYDNSCRSFDLQFYLKLATEIRRKYNLICMSEFQIPGDDISLRPEKLSIRRWLSVISNADYFIGCDSVGQHMAYSYNKPGSVILGATFAVNVSYPHHFNIIEKEGFEKKYDPIRISEPGSYESNMININSVLFNNEETKKIITEIMTDIKNKIGD